MRADCDRRHILWIGEPLWHWRMKRLAILAPLALVIGMALALVIAMGSAADGCSGYNCVLPGPPPIAIIIAGALLAIAIMRPAKT